MNKIKQIIPFSQRKKEFMKWHDLNPLIWVNFETFAFQAVHQRKKKISHWLIINRIRWEVFISTTGKDYKISNNYIAFYARLWREKYPEHKNLFSIKHMLGEPSPIEEENT
jgi:hypothetical protein